MGGAEVITLWYILGWVGVQGRARECGIMAIKFVVFLYDTMLSTVDVVHEGKMFRHDVDPSWWDGSCAGQTAVVGTVTVIKAHVATQTKRFLTVLTSPQQRLFDPTAHRLRANLGSSLARTSNFCCEDGLACDDGVPHTCPVASVACADDPNHPSTQYISSRARRTAITEAVPRKAAASSAWQPQHTTPKCQPYSRQPGRVHPSVRVQVSSNRVRDSRWRVKRPGDG